MTIFSDATKCLWTHSGRAMHICVSNQTIIGEANGLSPCRCQAIIWTKAAILFRNKLKWNFNLNSNNLIQQNAFEDVVSEMAIICLSLNVLNQQTHSIRPASTKHDVMVPTYIIRKTWQRNVFSHWRGPYGTKSWPRWVNFTYVL